MLRGNFGRKGQGAFEYILLVGGALAIVVLVLVVLRGGISQSGTAVSSEMDTAFCTASGVSGTADPKAMQNPTSGTAYTLGYTATGVKASKAAGVVAQVTGAASMLVSITSDTAGTTKIREDSTVPCSNGACSYRVLLNNENVGALVATVTCTATCGGGTVRAIRCT